MHTVEYIKKDLARYVATGSKKYTTILTNQGFFFTTVFRVNTTLYAKCCKVPVLKKLVAVHCLVWLKLSQIISGLSLPVGLSVGKGLYIGHAGTIIVNSNCTIGDNCNLSPDTVIGWGIKEGREGSPQIGNRVYIASGAKIFGPIRIGDDVVVGANAVVNSNVPNKSVVVGIPARVVSQKGSAEYVKF